MNLHLADEFQQWLADEIAQLEARLQGQGPVCQLDRQQASPPSLKADEGRYAMLRRAMRLRERGDAIPVLQAEAAKARAFLNGDAGLARDPVWRAYHAAVLAAVEELLRRWPAAPPA